MGKGLGLWIPLTPFPSLEGAGGVKRGHLPDAGRNSFWKSQEKSVFFLHGFFVMEIDNGSDERHKADEAYD